MSADFRFEDAELGYRGSTILREVDFAISAGTSVGVVGPNGSGKTTLLRTLLGILAPRKGQVERRPGLRWGFVPQRRSFDMVWPLSVGEVVDQGLLPTRGAFPFPRHEDRARVAAALESVELEGFEERPYRALSGGQQQRVLLARAMVGEPDWLILDEPTAGLDVPSQERTLRQVSAVRASREGLGVLLVSHQLSDVLNHCESIALVRDGAVKLASVDEVFDEEVLGEFYGLPVRCLQTDDGYRAVLPRHEEGAAS
jgi:ABC-type Mn2+/Zn2+ transport system ATPase subunit